MTIPTPLEIQAACRDLSARDPILKAAFDVVGFPEWRVAAPAYATLARAVTFQLISTTAASAIWQRMAARFGPDFSFDVILDASEADLRACGQSGPKIGHLKSIASAIAQGALDVDRLTRIDSADAERELLAVKGIGPWTANLFLLSALGKLDAFPAGDVGIMEAYRRLQEAEKRHTSKAFLELAEAWRPFRGVAAHLLWAWFNQNRAR